MLNIPDKQIKKILDNTKTIAVVGLSPKENRPSNMVARYLLAAGYRIIPVNPGQTEILGQTCYPYLTSIPAEVKVDLVDIFRRAEDIPPVVERAIKIGAKTVWMQSGIVNEDAAGTAGEAGLAVVMDRCLKVDHEFFYKGKV